jgi:hypothetical protein
MGNRFITNAPDIIPGAIESTRFERPYYDHNTGTTHWERPTRPGPPPTPTLAWRHRPARTLVVCSIAYLRLPFFPDVAPSLTAVSSGSTRCATSVMSVHEA